MVNSTEVLICSGLWKINVWCWLAGTFTKSVMRVVMYIIMKSTHERTTYLQESVQL